MAYVCELSISTMTTNCCCSWPKPVYVPGSLSLALWWFFAFTTNLDALYWWWFINTMETTILFLGLFICFWHYILAGRLNTWLTSWLTFEKELFALDRLYYFHFLYTYLLYACFMVTCIIIIIVLLLLFFLFFKGFQSKIEFNLYFILFYIISKL